LDGAAAARLATAAAEAAEASVPAPIDALGPDALAEDLDADTRRPLATRVAVAAAFAKDVEMDAPRNIR
jgi:hypothetical protein